MIFDLYLVEREERLVETEMQKMLEVQRTTRYWTNQVPVLWTDNLWVSQG